MDITEDKLQSAFEEKSKTSIPKFATLGECKQWHPYHPKMFAKNLLETIHHKDVAINRTDEDSRRNESQKLVWLIDQYKSVGFYSTPQAWIKPNGRWRVHPGSVRVNAMIQCKAYESKFVIWDDSNYLPDNKQVTYQEWIDQFPIPEGRTARFFDVEGMIEFHISEDRPTMYEYYLDLRKLYDGKRPKLIGTCDDSIKDLFGSGPVTVRGHITEDELGSFLELNPNNRKVTETNFTIVG